MSIENKISNAKTTQFFDDEVVDGWKKWLIEHDEQIRVEVIDECISKIDKLPTYYAGDKEGNAITPKVVIKEDVIKVLEQLKENRNE